VSVFAAVGCNDDDDDKKGGKIVEHNFTMETSLDTTIVQAGKSVGLQCVLSGIPEEDRPNLSFSFNFLANDYKGSFVFDGVSYYEGQDMAELFFNLDTLNVDFVTAAAVPESGSIDVVAIASTPFVSVQDTFSVFLKRPFSVEMLTKTLETGVNQPAYIKFKINEDFYNGKDVYFAGAYLDNMSVEAGAKGSFNWNHDTELKPDEEFSISYTPQTVGQHIVVIEVMNKDGEMFYVNAAIDVKSFLFTSWECSDCTADGLFNIRSSYGGDLYKSITFKAKEDGYSGKIFFSYSATDDKIKFIEMTQSGQKDCPANQQISMGNSKTLQLMATSADPTKVQEVYVTISDEIGNIKQYTFKIKYKLQVTLKSGYSAYTFAKTGYYDAGSVVTLEGIDETTFGRKEDKEFDIHIVVGWYVNDKYFEGKDVKVTVNKNLTVYPKVETKWAYVKIYDMEVNRWSESAYNKKISQKVNYGDSFTLSTTKGTKSAAGNQRIWQYTSDGGLSWVTFDHDDESTFLGTAQTITMLLRDNHFYWLKDLDLPQGGTVYFRYVDYLGN